MAMVNVKDLVVALNLVAPGLGNRENDIQATCFLFKDGRVHTYNDEVSVSCDLPKGMEGIDCTVQAKEILSLLQKTKDEEVDLSLGNAYFNIATRRSRACILVEEEEKMPIADLQIPTKWKKLPKDFLLAVQSCLPIVGKNMSKPLSTCLHMVGDRVETSDIDKAGRYTFDQDVFGEKQTYLPGTSAKTLAKFDDIEKYALSEGWIHFRCANGVILSARTYYENQEYADFTQLLSTKGTRLELPKDLSAVLERTGIFTEAKFGTETTISEVYAFVTLAKNWLTIRCESPVGNYEEKIRIEYEKTPVTFCVSPELLLTAVEGNRKCELCKNFVKIYDDKFVHLVAVQITDKAPPKNERKEVKELDEMPPF